MPKKPLPIKKHITGGFDVIGDAAIIRIPKGEKADYARKLAKKVMDNNKHIERVFKKIGKTEGEERVPKLVWVAGKRDSTVMHRENGCVFSVNIKKVFFTPRLSSERLRISRMVKQNESVLDMFCGVGPYSIQMAKNAREVYSIDINPEAVKELDKNVKLNKVINIVSFVGDSRKIVGKLHKKFDRIIMNFPLASYDFLDAALKVAKKTCTLHVYTFIDVSDGYEKAVKKAEEVLREKLPSEISITKINAKSAGEIAPYMVRECLDVYLRRKI